MDSRIARIEVYPIRAPRKEPVRSGLNDGSPVTASEFGILRIRTADGLTGIGEISITYPRIGHTLCFAAERLVAPMLLGQDAAAVPQRLADIDRVLAGELSQNYIRAAFEMALLDLTGRRHALPLYQLLGGRMRDRVPLAWGNLPEESRRDG